jgi:prepilin-type processing-associated H-X9-DG protein
MGARHGKKTANRRDAFTNFAFFDGHVAMFPTQPISKSGFGAFTRDHVFFLRKQQ